jgi:hypothetical protein
MHQFIESAVFWAVVLVAICVLARFPESWLGRIAFARLGPRPIRGEPRSRYLLRWAQYAAGWCAQALFVFAIGWEALRLNASLADALFFQVFWMTVVPLLAATGLVGALLALGAALWVRCVGAERRRRRGARAVHT